MRPATALLLLLLSLVPSAFADLTGEYLMSGDQRLILDYRDDNHIRAQLGSGDMLLVSGSKTWLVTDRGGSRMAIDVDQMGLLLGMVGGAAEAAIPAAGSVRIEATGDTETLAGYQGEWYVMDDGEHQYRVLLSDAPEVVTLTRGFARIAARLSKMLGPERAGELQQLMDEAMQQGPGGVLRQADQLRLTAVRQDTLPGSTYQLPADAQPVSLPGF